MRSSSAASAGCRIVERRREQILADTGDIGNGDRRRTIGPKAMRDAVQRVPRRSTRASTRGSRARTRQPPAADGVRGRHRTRTGRRQSPSGASMNLRRRDRSRMRTARALDAHANADRSHESTSIATANNPSHRAMRASTRRRRSHSASSSMPLAVAAGEPSSFGSDNEERSDRVALARGPVRGAHDCWRRTPARPVLDR